MVYMIHSLLPFEVMWTTGRRDGRTDMGINIGGEEKKTEEGRGAYMLDNIVNRQPNYSRGDESKQKRKTRSDKKKDIRIPISEDLYNRINYQADRNDVSATYLATQLTVRALMRNNDFPEVHYETSDYSVHVILEPEMKDTVLELKRQWKYKSWRQTVHRIFMFIASTNIYDHRGGADRYDSL